MSATSDISDDEEYEARMRRLSSKDEKDDADGFTVVTSRKQRRKEKKEQEEETRDVSIFSEAFKYLQNPVLLNQYVTTGCIQDSGKYTPSALKALGKRKQWKWWHAYDEENKVVWDFKTMDDGGVYMKVIHLAEDDPYIRHVRLVCS